MKIAFIALMLVGCGLGTPSREVQEPIAASCDPGMAIVRIAADVKMTPYVWDMFSACSATDDPESYGHVWCCPASK
jgi:hypothetical protein